MFVNVEGKKTATLIDFCADPYMVLPATFMYLVNKNSTVLNLEQAVTDTKVYHVGPQLVTIKLENTAYSREVDCVVADSVENRNALLGPAWVNGRVSERSKAQEYILNKFSKAIEWNGTVVGPDENNKLPFVDLGIDITKKAKEISYRLSPVNLEKFKKIHEECIRNNVVAEVPNHVDRSLLSPMMPVLPKKDDGTARLCINGHELKNITSPLPCQIDPLLTLKTLKKGNYYCSFDMSSFFFQIPVQPEQAYRQCYLQEGKLFYIKGIMQGAANGSTVADKLLNSIMDNIGIQNKSVYVDDVLLSRESVQDCVKDMEIILNEFASCGLRVNGWKFIIASNSPILLNHVIRPDHIKPGIKYRRLLKDLNSVSNYATLAYSLNYFVKSVPKLQDVLLNIRRKVQEEGGDKSSKSPSHELSSLGSDAIDLVSKAEIELIDYNKEVDLLTDWSKSGSGIVLAQNGRPWLVHSIKHNVTMSSLPPPIGELATVAQSLNTLYKFVKGLKIRLKTDALAVKKAMENVRSNKISSYATYIIAVILEHNISFDYIKGESNPADIFSRIINNTIHDSINVNPVAHAAVSENQALSRLKELHNMYHSGFASFKIIADHESKKENFEYQISDLKNIINNCDGCKFTLTLPCVAPFKSKSNRDDSVTYHMDSSSLGRWNGAKFYLITLKSKLHADSLVFNGRPTADLALELLKRNKGKNILKLICDAGKEFDNYLIKDYCLVNNISLEILPQSLKTANGLVEVHHRILKDKLRPMVFLNGLPSLAVLGKWINTINSIHNFLPKQSRSVCDFSEANIKVGDRLILLKKPYPPFGRTIAPPPNSGIVTVEDIRGKAISVRKTYSNQRLTVSIDRLRIPKPNIT